MSRPVLEVENLTVTYGHGAKRTTAVDSVSLEVAEGTTFGILGESGSGKTSLGRAVLGLVNPKEGSIKIDGVEVKPLRIRRAPGQGKSVQVVFQDPIGSLNPARRVIDSLGEPLRIHQRYSREARVAAIERLTEQVGLDPTLLGRKPMDLSGGQCQRIAIARAVASTPRLIVCDEPVTGLDPPTRAKVLRLLAELQATHSVAYLFISHDVMVVRRLSDRIGVMYAGRLIECGPAGEVITHPMHPYTAELLAAAPDLDHKHRTKSSPDPTKQKIPPEPDTVSRSHGCAYASQCTNAQSTCWMSTPALRTSSRAHQVACHFPLVSNDKRV